MSVTVSIHTDGYPPKVKIHRGSFRAFAVVIIAEGAEVYADTPERLRTIAQAFTDAAAQLEAAQVVS